MQVEEGKRRKRMREEAATSTFLIREDTKYK
jgi:hypothetical protein